MERAKAHKLKRVITELKQVKGRHTELVSVYVPQGYDIIKIINHLKQEQGTASNIKDKTTRKNVIDSLEKMIRHLRLYKRTPENGLAVFAGNIAAKEGKANIKVWSIEPPEPINTRKYRCDQTFDLELIEGMLEYKDTYGLIVLDLREANIGMLKGTSIMMIRELSSAVPGKIKAGGYSQQRYARIREIAMKEFFDKIGDVANKEFLGKKDLKGILLGGPGLTKEKFLAEEYLNNELKKKIIGIKDTTYTGEFGLNELVEKSKDVLAELEITKEKEIVKEFFTMLAKSSEKVAYRMKNVEKALEMGAVDKLLISESIEEKDATKLEEGAEKTGATVFFISTETQEGAQLKDIGGVAAILRFAIS